jgi:hypothetical protein
MKGGLAKPGGAKQHEGKTEDAETYHDFVRCWRAFDTGDE